jgi:hypothetical protein
MQHSKYSVCIRVASKYLLLRPQEVMETLNL